MELQESNKPILKKRRFKIKLTIIFIVVACFGMLSTFSIYKYNKSNSAKTYTKEFQDNFIESCLAAGGSAKSCNCSIHYIYDNYSYEEAMRLDEYAKSSGESPPELTEAFSRCSQQ